MHTGTGHIVTPAELEAMRRESSGRAEEYAPLPKHLSRAAQRVLDRGSRFPDPVADPALTAHLAKLRKRRKALEKAGRRAARKGHR